jgi:2-keto-4-pentenoate hydratase
VTPQEMQRVVGRELGVDPSDLRTWLTSRCVRRASREARRLRNATRHGERIPMPEGMTVEQGYEVQRLNACSRIMGGARPVGYKVGLTSKAMQAQFGIDTPDRGIVFDDALVTSGSTLDAGVAGTSMLEVEFALVLGARPDVRSDASPRLEIVGGFLCFEILQTRYNSWQGTVATSVADNAGLGKVVVGGQIDTDVEATVLDNVTTLRRNGKVVGAGSGHDLDGGPWGSARWLMSSIGPLDPRVRPGHFIMTGSMMSAVDVRAGDHFEAASADGATVEVMFR